MKSVPLHIEHPTWKNMFIAFIESNFKTFKLLSKTFDAFSYEIIEDKFKLILEISLMTTDTSSYEKLTLKENNIIEGVLQIQLKVYTSYGYLDRSILTLSAVAGNIMSFSLSELHKYNFKKKIKFQRGVLSVNIKRPIRVEEWLDKSNFSIDLILKSAQDKIRVQLLEKTAQIYMPTAQIDPKSLDNLKNIILHYYF